ncbi:remodeling and spacing factor 1 isoform X2 [Topomyia yanbarensis]|uniref:remodeling and spacing factor 1 isoform X2 n=1 Tax=Topomyia yanbarensis TaxID=2498891 RepID=UPI00273B7D5B|nr:remodeling and spacing factor 1 isoform X2 [Topomyia yanbarensis]
MASHSVHGHGAYMCTEDPNFSIICMFLEKFSGACGIDTLGIDELSSMIQDTNNVAPVLEELHIKLLRKIRKCVPAGKWENALIKFAYTYSNQDAWEIERFGYKNANVVVKLRILKVLLEAQFDSNVKLKSYINRVNAEELRSKPLGHDKFGNRYWCVMDKHYSIKIFQENLDDESWAIIASDRNDVVRLIENFKLNSHENPDIIVDDTKDSSLILDRREYKRDLSDNLFAISNECVDTISNEYNFVNQTDKGNVEPVLCKTQHSLASNIKVDTKVAILGSQNIKNDNQEKSETNVIGQIFESSYNDDKFVSGETIEEDTLIVLGEGSGAENNMGNITNETNCIATRKTNTNLNMSNTTSGNLAQNFNTKEADCDKIEYTKNINDVPLKEKPECSNLYAEKCEVSMLDISIVNPKTDKCRVDLENYSESDGTSTAKNENSKGISLNSPIIFHFPKVNVNTKYHCKGQQKDSQSIKKEEKSKDTQKNNPSNSIGRKSKNISELKENHLNLECNHPKFTNDENEDSVSNQKKKYGLVNGKVISEFGISSFNLPGIRQSRRIAQQKIREETNRRMIEDKMLRELKAEAIRNKQKSSSSYDEDYVISDDEDSRNTETKIKKKKCDKPWMASSSESSSESEPEEEPELSDDGKSLARSDHEFSPESDIESECVIPTKRARTVRVERLIDGDGEMDDDHNVDHACQKCGRIDHPEWILLCDSCDKGYHCSCLLPVLFNIPEGDWFCPLCQHNRLIERLEEKILEYDEICKQLDDEHSSTNQKCSHEIPINEDSFKLVENDDSDSIKRNPKSNQCIAKKKNIRDKGPSSTCSSEEDITRKHSSTSETDCDDIPVYRLRRRSRTRLNYRFNDYDNLINSAINRDEYSNDYTEQATCGKDITNILKSEACVENIINQSENKSLINQSGRDNTNKASKKRNKFNSLDFTSEEDDGSDEDFNGVITDDEESQSLTEDSESSLELLTSRRFRAATNKKKDKEFIDDDDSDQSSYNIRTRPCKTKHISEESDEFEEEDPTESEEVDSEELCNDTETDSSQDVWVNRNNRTKYVSQTSSSKSNNEKKKKRIKENEDSPYKSGIKKKPIIKDSDSDQSLNNSNNPIKRRTRGRKLHFILDEDFESSDDGITPGVLRPDTPPEERERFILKQEEIKRMLAEKNTAAAKALATPTIIPLTDANVQGKQTALSTVPSQVIENAKILDVDFIKSSKNTDSQDFDVALAVSFTESDDVNEDELAKIMEDEDFAQHQLKLEDEGILKNKIVPDDSSKKKARDFHSIDPTEVNKRDGKIMLPVDKRYRNDHETMSSISAVNHVYLDHVQDTDSSKNTNFVSNIPRVPSASSKSSSLLEQMKQQAIPLRDCEEAIRHMLQPSELTGQNSYIPLLHSVQPETFLTAHKLVPVVDISEMTNCTSVIRRRRKKITPLRGDFNRTIGKQVDASKQSQHHTSALPIINENSVSVVHPYQKPQISIRNTPEILSDSKVHQSCNFRDPDWI